MNLLPFTLRCPYCGERFDSAADPGGADAQQHIEDCAICCRPICVTVHLDPDGAARAVARRDDEA